MRAREREPYVSHWEEEHAVLDALAKRRGLAGLGAADRDEWLVAQDFHHRVSAMLAWVADTLMPRGREGLDAAVELLQRSG